MVLPGATENTYEVKGDAITLFDSVSKKKVMSATYKLENGKLLMDDGKGIIHYFRTDAPK